MKVLLLYAIVFATISIIVIGCKSKTVYVPVESVKTEYKDRWLRDSIYLSDSVFVDRWKSGDTVYTIKEKYKYIYRDKTRRDSIFINDTIRVPYPVIETKTVEAPYTWYVKVLLALGCISIGYFGFWVYRWIKR